VSFNRTSASAHACKSCHGPRLAGVEHRCSPAQIENAIENPMAPMPNHPMHLHGHVFDIVEVGGRVLRVPLAKDVALVPADGGTMTWRFTANSPKGRWLLHCHKEIHMMSGLMTEVFLTSNLS
jgi:hypothetical protein